jgi:hypothetical protein
MTDALRTLGQKGRLKREEPMEITSEEERKSSKRRSVMGSAARSLS